MEVIVENNVWECYTNKNTQEFTSKKTARVQLPRISSYFTEDTKVVLDIGCGGIKNIKLKKYLEDLGYVYYGIDPFNIAESTNLSIIEEITSLKADIIILSNVLNTIKEPKVWRDILLQASLCMHETSELLITVYEGELTSTEKKEGKDKSPIVTRDGYQNRMLLKEYLPHILKVFPNTTILPKKIIRSTL